MGTGTATGGAGAPGGFRVKVTQLGKDVPPNLVDVSPGETVGQIVRRAGLDPEGRQIRVDGQPVSENHVPHANAGVIAVADRIAAGVEI